MKDLKALSVDEITRILVLFIIVFSIFAFTLFADEPNPFAEVRQQEPSGAEQLLRPVPGVSADGFVIDSLEIVGNVSLTREEVLSMVRVRAGEVFDSDYASEDVQRIAENEAVEYAYYNTQIKDDLVVLTYVVVERNLIREVMFSGNERVSDSKLLSETGLREGDYLDIFLVRNALEVIKQYYSEKGFGFARVSLREDALERGQVIFDIEEGQRVKVARILFQGNDSIKSGDLATGIKTKVRNFFFWPGYYVPQKVEEDVDRLEEIYQNKGYLDVSVSYEAEFTEKKDKVVLTFNIEQGSVYITESIALEGNTFFEQEDLLAENRLKAGEFYSDQKADFALEKMLSRYLSKGFINADVTYQRLFPEQGKVKLVYQVSQGERFKIGHIAITGNQSTYDKVIRRVLDEEDFKPGNWYNADIARGNGKGDLETDLRRTIYAQGAFIRPTGQGEGVRNALVNVTEGQTGSVMFGAGVASDSGLIGQLSFDQRNFDISNWPDSFLDIFSGEGFKGAGQRLNISLEPGTEYSRYSFSFTEPYLYDKPVAFSVGGLSFERERESYDEERLKGYISLEKRYQDDWRRGIAFRTENVDIGEVAFDAPQEIFDVAGDNLLFGVKLFIGKDTTDDRFLPSEGYNFDAGYEQVTGDHNFGILSATQRWYKTLHEDYAGLKTILETKMHGATVVGDAPPFEKFYAGGIGTLRGFEYRGVSTRGVSRTNPAKKEDPIGSDWIILGNAEVAVPLGNETFSALFFTDAGMIDSGGVRASVGTGIQILLPQWFGPVPMRFELATPLIKDDSDETRVFSFSVGALF